MSEIFLKDDIITLLDNRFIVIIGDSNQRAVYKDLVLLLQRNKYLTENQLRTKGEMTFLGDQLIEGGRLGEMSNGVGYREVRQYQTDFHLVRFYFITRCYNSYMESILADLSEDPLPDVVMMNSCLWDISRYGRRAVSQYKENVETLFTRFKQMLPPTCLVIWNTTLPISKKARGGVLIPAVEFMNNTLRLDILEANFYVHKLAMSFGFNVLDLHYFLRHQLQRRAGDGVHWDMTAHRRITNLILTHIAQAWDVNPPQHARKLLYQKEKNPTTDNRFIRNQAPESIQQPSPSYGTMSNLNFNFCHNLGQNVISQVLPGNMVYLQQAQPVLDQQQVFIERYGGPIRVSNYNTAAVEQTQYVSDQEQFSWEPYGNRNFDPNLRSRMYSDRINPYVNQRVGKSWNRNDNYY